MSPPTSVTNAADSKSDTLRQFWFLCWTLLFKIQIWSNFLEPIIDLLADVRHCLKFLMCPHYPLLSTLHLYLMSPLLLNYYHLPFSCTHPLIRHESHGIPPHLPTHRQKRQRKWQQWWIFGRIAGGRSIITQYGAQSWSRSWLYFQFSYTALLPIIILLLLLLLLLISVVTNPASCGCWCLLPGFSSFYRSYFNFHWTPAPQISPLFHLIYLFVFVVDIPKTIVGRKFQGGPPPPPHPILLRLDAPPPHSTY